MNVARGEAGSLSLFFVVSAVALLALVGLVLDGGSRLLLQERADAVAREAARAACESIDPKSLLDGQFLLDQKAMQRASVRYLRLSSTDGTHWHGSAPRLTNGGQTCTVTVSTTYNTKLLALIGIHKVGVTGTGTATFYHGVTTPDGGT